MTFPIPRGALVVSCQARPDNPLHGPVHMAAMARAAGEGGAGGIRANGVDDIRAIRAATPLPLIGILKRFDDRFPVAITPDLASALAVAEARGVSEVEVAYVFLERPQDPVTTLLDREEIEAGKARVVTAVERTQASSPARRGAALAGSQV